MPYPVKLDTFTSKVLAPSLNAVEDHDCVLNI
jgi:hypothetical protein